MAIFRPGSIVGAISGNVGGVNFVAGKGAPIARQRIRRTKNNSPALAHSRANLARLRTQWRAITEEQRNAWRQAALIYPHRNRLGLATQLSGIALYIKANMERSAIPGLPFQFQEDEVPDLTTSAPLQASSLAISISGDYTILISEPISTPYNQVLLYGGRTYKNNSLRSWNQFVTLQFSILVAPPTTLSFATKFKEILGDAILGEQIWVRARFGSGSRLLTAPQDLSTHAVA